MFTIFLDSVCKILQQGIKKTCVCKYDADLQMWFKIRPYSDVWFSVRPAYALSECAFCFLQGSVYVRCSCNALRTPSPAGMQKYWGQDTRSLSLISAGQDLCAVWSRSLTSYISRVWQTVLGSTTSICYTESPNGLHIIYLHKNNFY